MDLLTFGQVDADGVSTVQANAFPSAEQALEAVVGGPHELVCTVASVRGSGHLAIFQRAREDFEDDGALDDSASATDAADAPLSLDPAPLAVVITTPAGAPAGALEPLAIVSYDDAGTPRSLDAAEFAQCKAQRVLAPGGDDVIALTITA